MSLLNKIKHYALLCQASIRNDMAKRIMHSILPSLSNPAESHWTGGAIDYKSLQYATEGWQDIVKYGLKSCVNETEHYKSAKNGGNTYEKALNYLNEGNYELCIETCISAFKATEGWQILYGGEAWLNIAECIKNIYEIGKELEKSDGKQKINAMNAMVVALNVFDGLSHNTESVMRKVIEYESDDIASKIGPASKYTYSSSRSKKEYEKTKRLMDSKELINPIDVYHEVKQTLTDSGDINKYKDWNTKIRSNPEYYKNDIEKREQELAKIDVKKKVLIEKRKSDVYKCLDDAKNIINTHKCVDEGLLFKKTYGEIKFSKINSYFDKISLVLYAYNKFPDEYRILRSKYDSLKRMTGEIIYLVYDDMEKNDTQELRQKIDKQIKEYIDFAFMTLNYIDDKF